MTWRIKGGENPIFRFGWVRPRRRGLLARVGGVASVVDGSFETDPLGQIKTETPTSTDWYMGSGMYAYGYTWIMDNTNSNPNTIHLTPDTFVASPEGPQFLGQDTFTTRIQ